MKVSNERFVRAWMVAYKQDRNHRWIAEALDIDIRNVHAKAHYLRKKGVNLPSLRTRGYSKVDVGYLNTLITDAKQETM